MSARRYTLQPAGSLCYVAPGRNRDSLGESPKPRPPTVAPAEGGKFVNQHGARLGRRNPYPSERRGPLDRAQKARLCILARAGFERLHDRAPATADELTQWRREQQTRACGLTSLTHADQRHWPALEAHFLDLAGESGQAFTRLLKPELAEQRKALAVLRQHCAQRGLSMDYPSAICRQQYKCTLGEASPKQLWRLVFTVKNRRKTTR